ncbi:MAG TPA: hypothetical protein V6C72_18070 [Chroococcales cyanobacterium]
MISEELTNERAAATSRLMKSLADAVDKFLAKDDADAASKVADSLTLLIVKTHEVEALGNAADAMEKLSRTAGKISRKHDLGDLD